MQIEMVVESIPKIIYALSEGCYLVHNIDGTFSPTNGEDATLIAAYYGIRIRPIEEPTEVCDDVNGSVLIEPDGTVTPHRELLTQLREVADKLKILNFKPDYLAKQVTGT